MSACWQIHDIWLRHILLTKSCMFHSKRPWWSFDFIMPEAAKQPQSLTEPPLYWHGVLCLKPSFLTVACLACVSPLEVGPSWFSYHRAHLNSDSNTRCNLKLLYPGNVVDEREVWSLEKKKEKKKHRNYWLIILCRFVTSGTFHTSHSYVIQC